MTHRLLRLYAVIYLFVAMKKRHGIGKSLRPEM
jgi:hypothetical protein